MSWAGPDCVRSIKKLNLRFPFFPGENLIAIGSVRPTARQGPYFSYSNFLYSKFSCSAGSSRIVSWTWTRSTSRKTRPYHSSTVRRSPSLFLPSSISVMTKLYLHYLTYSDETYLLTKKLLKRFCSCLFERFALLLTPSLALAGSVTLSLAEGIMHDVFVSSVVSGGNIVSKV